MRANRKAAREFAMNIKTRADLEAYLDMLNLRDDEREIAILIFGKGWSRDKIAIETGYSKNQLNRKIARIYDKMA